MLFMLSIVFFFFADYSIQMLFRQLKMMHFRAYHTLNICK